MLEQRLKSTGITRNRMSELHRFKGRKKAPLKRFSKASLRKQIDDDELIKSSLLATKASEIEMTVPDEPVWVGNYKECAQLLREVDALQADIAKEKMRKMSAVQEQKHDLIIQKLVDEATAKLNRCEKRLKTMEVQGATDTASTHTDRKAFTSMLISMATNIREQARRLRSQQQTEIHRERELKSYNRDVTEVGEAGMEREVEQWLSEAEFEELEASMLRERDQEVSKVVQSIHSLNAIYKELQNLVIEQGSLLDRIDENIDRTVHSVQEATKNLQEANKKSENSCFAKLRLFLIAAIGVLFLILILKHS